MSEKIRLTVIVVALSDGVLVAALGGCWILSNDARVFTVAVRTARPVTSYCGHSDLLTSGAISRERCGRVDIAAESSTPKPTLALTLVWHCVLRC